MTAQASAKPANDPGPKPSADGQGFNFNYSAHHANGQPRTTVSSSLGRQFFEALFDQFSPATKFVAYGILLTIIITGALRLSHQWHVNSMQSDLQRSTEDLRSKCFALTKWAATKDCLASLPVANTDLGVGEVEAKPAAE